MGTVSPSKFSSLSYLKSLASNWHTGKNGKEYEIEEVNQLIWEKENKIQVPPREEIPKEYMIEYLTNEELESEIKFAKIFKDNSIGELLMEKGIRKGIY